MINLATLYGKLPVLYIDGKIQIAESFAIARFLARKYNLAGRDDVESAILDSLADLYKDFMSEIKSYMGVVFTKQESDKVN